MELIYDATNFLRRRLEGGASVRLCYAEVKGQPGTVVFDGRGAKQRRVALYSAYKLHRAPLVTSIYAQFDLFQETLQCLDVPVITVPGYEADDVIATLVRSQDGPVHIRSNDVDFLQLPNVTIDREKPPPCPPQELRLYKTMVGDQSDNIPGAKGFGEKAWSVLTDNDKEDLTKYLEGVEDYYPAALPNATKNWLDEPTNRDLVRVFWKIIDLWNVPMDEIIANTTVGVNAPEKVEENLMRFLQ